jgi:hypothetical protein
LKKRKCLISIIFVILIFFGFCNPVHASIFSKDDDKETDIEATINKEDGGLFEKVIAKMIRWSRRNSF